MKAARILPFVLIAISVFDCTQSEGQSFKKLSINTFEKEINKSSEKIILDVRTSKEFEAAHLKNVTNIDIHDREFEQKIRALDKSKPVYVYCASGIRSERAAAVLSENGFKKVYHMDGGLNEWIKANKSVEK